MVRTWTFSLKALPSFCKTADVGRREPVYMVLTWEIGSKMLSAVARIHLLEFPRYSVTPRRKRHSNNNDIIASRLPTPASTTTGLPLLSAPDRGQVSNQRRTSRAPMDLGSLPRFRIREGLPRIDFQQRRTSIPHVFFCSGRKHPLSSPSPRPLLSQVEYTILEEVEFGFSLVRLGICRYGI